MNTTRRQFLKRTAATSAAVAIVPVAGIAAAAGAIEQPDIPDFDWEVQINERPSGRDILLSAFKKEGHRGDRSFFLWYSSITTFFTGQARRTHRVTRKRVSFRHMDDSTDNWVTRNVEHDDRGRYLTDMDLAESDDHIIEKAKVDLIEMLRREMA